MKTLAKIVLLLLTAMISGFLVLWGWYGPALGDGTQETQPIQLVIGLLLLPTFIVLVLSLKVFGQSSNCATATQINLVGGVACVNGTNAGAITDNILYGGCNASPVNMVWYTYVTNGSNNTFTVIQEL